MKKFLFLFLFGALGFSLMAQDNSTPAYTFGVRAGVNGSSLLIRQISFSYISGKNYTSTQKMKIGAHAGFVFEARNSSAAIRKAISKSPHPAIPSDR